MKYTIDDALTIEANDAYEAAEIWADRHDWNTAEFAIVSGTPAEVEVRDEDGNVWHLRVEGHTERKYHAEERDGGAA